jgi:hypothetical protein
VVVQRVVWEVEWPRLPLPTPPPLTVQGGQFEWRLAARFGGGDVEDAHSWLQRHCNDRLCDVGGTTGGEAWA